MFLDYDELIDITIYYKKKGRHYDIFSQNKYEELKEEDKKSVNILNLKTKPLTWGLFNDMQEAGYVSDNLGNREFNYKAFKENKLLKIIAKWDAKTLNEEGKEIVAPINRQNISRLAPEIAETILDTYDRITRIDEDEEKKS